MLASLIIVFREILEAGLVVGLVLAGTRGVPGRSLWVAGGIGSGVLGAFIVAFFAERLYAAFAGSGQELFNAAVLGTAVLMLGWHNIWMGGHGRAIAAQSREIGRAVAGGERTLLAIALVVALAVLREGSEVVLFLFGIAAGGGEAAGMATGSALGILGGGVLSAVLYLGLLRIPLRHLFGVTSWMITLLAAGMASQCVFYLGRAGVLPFLADELWDTSWLLRDDSLLGLTFKTLVGYTDRPSGMQLLAWLATIIAIAGLQTMLRTEPGASRQQSA